ncbi:MAG TPA: SRPBCC domain-containing protein [Candidatus Binatia bacterium]|nr:SRPBCC domain-containing protein [Candidatus Binatia bacterium]
MSDNKKLVITRVLDAPLSKVWQAWVEQEQVVQWWGPYGATNPTCEWDARPGGKINILMLAGKELGPLAGQEWPMNGEFRSVEPEKKLVFTTAALSRSKAILENQVTVTFEEQGSKTKLTVDIVVTRITKEAEGPLAGMEMGWNQQLDKLTKHLA